MYCIKQILYSLLICCCLAACKDVRQQHVKCVTDKTEDVSLGNDCSFPFIEIPSLITQPEEQRNYYLKHYWDNYDFSDTVLVNNECVAEQGVAELLFVLLDSSTSDKQIQYCFKQICCSMEKYPHVYKVFSNLIDDYLYNPNSPYYSEKLYAFYLERILSSEMQESYKSTFRFKLDLIKRNNPGNIASSFVYYLPDGTKTSLAETVVSGKYLVLFFYDPDCPQCHKIVDDMIADESLKKAVDDGKVTVLAVYTEGDEDVWLRSLNDMPESWIIGNDKLFINNNALYDLKAMPSLYLLDANKRVILKDASFNRICSMMGIF